MVCAMTETGKLILTTINTQTEIMRSKNSQAYLTSMRTT